MRIAIFSITYDPFIGGAEVAIKEVAKRLSSDFEFSARGGPSFGWDLFTARLDPNLLKEERIGNINVYRSGSGRPFLDKILYPLRASRLALKMHKKNPYDIIHAVLETYAGLAALLFKKKEPVVPYILTLQSGDSDWFIRIRSWIWNMIFWTAPYHQIYVKADKITAISNWLKDRALRYGYKKEVVIIPNGVDIKKFDIQISEQERSSVRKSWGADDNDFVVITASRLVYKNGIDVLIRAMNYLPENVRLVIAGEGKEFKKFKVQSSKHVPSMSEGFKDRVVFLGHIEHSDLPRLLKSADAFARPSRTEGLGISFIEAKAALLPVIGTRVGGIADLIDKGIVIPVKQENSIDIAREINRLIDSPDYCKEKSLQGIEAVKNDFNWNFIAQQYKKEYQKLCIKK